MSSSTWGLVDQSISIILTLHRKFIDKISSICSTFVESIPSNNPPSLLEQNSRAPFKRRPSSKFERSLLKEAPRVSFPAGQLPDNEANNPASVTPLPGRCPTRGSSEIQISHARHFSRSLSLSLPFSVSSQRPRSRGWCEDNRRTGLFHGREFYLALPPFNLINRGGSWSPSCPGINHLPLRVCIHGRGIKSRAWMRTDCHLLRGRLFREGLHARPAPLSSGRGCGY